jgi:hypothetical protein
MRFASTRSAAAPGTAQDARTRPVANHTAPVRAGSCAAVEPVDGRSVRLTLLISKTSGGPASGAGVAGMAGSAGAGRPGTFEVPNP